MASFKGHKIASSYATCSIGHKEKHNLPSKLEAIAQAGFDAIELSMPDILSYGQEVIGKKIDPKDYTTLVEIGERIRDLCQQHGLKILMLQPFANFEGWPSGSSERQDAFDRAKGWVSIMKAVGTDMLQIGSSDSPHISSSFDELAADLRELADVMASDGFRIAYENWCWATHCPDWKDVWAIVKKADRSNIGLCLDTFQSAGGEWANPKTESGLLEDASRDEIETRWRQSCRELAATIPPDKIFLLQVSDAYKMESPIPNRTDGSGLRPRGQWSHDFRPLPYDGGYLPVTEFTKAVLGTGFRGWFSIEVFDGQAPKKYDDDMAPYAKKAMGALQRLLDDAAN